MRDPATIEDLPPLPPIERLQELLYEACRLGRDDMIFALLQAGAGIETRNEKGYTPLILASYNGHAAATALLIAHGADVNGADGTRGNTALMGVAFKGYDAIAEMLVAGGADVGQRNNEGQTALMNAAMFGHAAIVELLLKQGVDPAAVDAAGNGAASLAAAQGNQVMVARIEHALAGSDESVG